MNKKTGTLLILTIILASTTIAQVDSSDRYTPEELEEQQFQVTENYNYPKDSTKHLDYNYTQENQQITFENVEIPLGRSEQITKPNTTDQAIEIYKNLPFNPDVETEGDSGTSYGFKIQNEELTSLSQGLEPRLLTDQNGQLSLKENLIIQFENSQWTLNSFKPKPASDFAENKIKHQYYGDPREDLEIDIKRDVKPLTLTALRAEYPFKTEDSKLETQFQADRLDLDKIEVYECGIWNFEEKHCKTDWGAPIDKENIETNLVSGVVNLDKLGAPQNGENGISTAYMIGIERGLGSPITLEDSLKLSHERISVDDSVYFEGTLVDERNQEPVTSTDLNITLINQENTDANATVEAKTGSEGQFSTPPLNAPGEPGKYKIQIQSVQEPYDPLNKEKENQIEIYETAELRLSPPSQPEIKPGETTTEVWTLENTGQATLNNITIKETKIPSEEGYYTISPSEINQIERDETQAISLTYRLPTDYCPQEKSCETQTQATTQIQATTEHNNETIQTESEEEFELTNTNQQENEQQEEDKQESQILPSNLEIPTTGDAIKQETDLETVLLVATALLFAAIIAIKIKKKKTSKPTKKDKQQAKEKSQEEQNESDETDEETEKLEEAIKKQQKDEQEQKEDSEDFEIDKEVDDHLRDLKSQVKRK